MTQRAQLIQQNGRTELFKGNELRAYVEDDILHGIDRDGYAVRIGEVEHRAQIIPAWEKWQAGKS